MLTGQAETVFVDLVATVAGTGCVAVVILTPVVENFMSQSLIHGDGSIE